MIIPDTNSNSPPIKLAIFRNMPTSDSLSDSELRIKYLLIQSNENIISFINDKIDKTQKDLKTKKRH